MTTLTEKFDALETQLEAADAAMQVDLNAVRAQLELVNLALETLNNNGATNTRYLLQALAANDPCGCADVPTVRIPPLGVGDVGIGEDQCKRIQAFLHTMQEIFVTLDFASAFSIGLNFSLIKNSLDEVVTSIESGSDLPVISYPEAIQLIGDMVNYVAGNLLVGSSLSAYFSSVLLALRSGMSLSTSPGDMKSSYDGVIDDSSLPSYVKPVLKNAAYGALYTYYFDPDSTPNLTGYDGTLCGGALIDITSCHNFTSVPFFSTPVTLQVIDLPPRYGGHIGRIQGDFIGWSVRVVSIDGGDSVKLYRWTDPDTLNLLDESVASLTPMNISDHTAAITIQTGSGAGDGDPFIVEICPPA